jgi:hypothetical protein
MRYLMMMLDSKMRLLQLMKKNGQVNSQDFR